MKRNPLAVLAEKCVEPSTLEFWRQGRELENFGVWDWLHGYVYGRWTYLYVSVALGEHKLTKPLLKLWDILEKVLTPIGPLRPKERSARERIAHGYHGKVVPVSGARRIITVNRPVEIKDLEQVIPYDQARSILLKDPDHIVALECPCRSCRENPCTPLDVCLVVGEPFASFIVHHHPGRARWVSQSEAEDILRAEHERGHVHHAFFKDAILQRFYAICNCCSCCCGAIRAHHNGVPMLASSGYLATVDGAECKGCGMCASKCPFDAIQVVHDQGGKRAVVNTDACMGCGVCVPNCPTNALALSLAPEKGLPLEI